MRQIVFLFGEAEKGEFCKPYYCQTLDQLASFLGNPPPETSGLHFAVQTVLLKRDCIFFRVKEEGFSADDYFRGLHLIEKASFLSPLLAIGVPGVGDMDILHATGELCQQKKSTLIVTEKDLYDYLTCF